MKPKCVLKKSQITSVLEGGIEYSNPLDGANELNSIYASVERNISNSFVSIIIILRVLQRYIRFTLNSPRNKKFLKLLKLSKINRVISQLIQLKLKKKLNPFITTVLTKLIKRSLLTGHFPSLLKTACVVPIEKGGNLNKMNNYRPISVLPILSKVFEISVFNRLSHYLQNFKLLAKINMGFESVNLIQT